MFDHVIQDDKDFTTNKKKLRGRLGKLRTILRLRILQKQLYLEGLLEKYRLIKRIFVMEVERGQEVFIPPDLSIKALPMSYRFYDPIFHIVESLVSNEKKQIFNMKTQYCLSNLREKDRK